MGSGVKRYSSGRRTHSTSFAGICSWRARLSRRSLEERSRNVAGAFRQLQEQPPDYCAVVLRVSVVEVPTTGCCTVLSSVVVVEVADGFFSTTVVQDVNAARLRMQAISRCFIGVLC
jgi:hypothetical protein